MLRRARCVQRALHQYLANRFGTSCGTPAVPPIPHTHPTPPDTPAAGEAAFLLVRSPHGHGSLTCETARVAPTWPVAQNPDVMWRTAGMEARRGPDADRFWGKGNSRDLECRRDPRRLPALRVVKRGSEASRRVGGRRFLTPPTPTRPECVTRLCRPHLPWLWMFACLHSPTFRQVSKGSCSCVLGSVAGREAGTQSAVE